MKRKIISIALSLAMVAVCALTLSTTASAGTSTYTDIGTYSAGTATQDGVAAGTVSNEVDIDVQAQTTGGGDIIYSVKIDWGNMKFEYDYGYTWDPTTHSYSAGSSGSAGGGWNTTTYLDGTNNKITVTNDSNFPINADFTYDNTSATTFNADNTTATAVKGMFNATNSTLKGIVDANTIDTRTITNPTLPLNTAKSGLVAGDTYYYQGTDDGVYTGNMYFSLIGKPDRGLGLTTMQSVGGIKVKITPATATTAATKS